MKFYSFKDFKKNVVFGQSCFVCGLESGAADFNDEHVIPDWMLRECDLYNKSITLANGVTIKYDRYKIKCCEVCNANLGEIVEAPVANLFKMPYGKFAHSLIHDQAVYRQVFRWMTLVYLKTHLKDVQMYWNLDRRQGLARIADKYSWGNLHHYHTIARSHYTRALIKKEVFGTLVVLPVLSQKAAGKFDYVDSSFGDGLMLRLGDICIMTILNDSCAVLNLVFEEIIKKLRAPLTHFQLRDVFAHLVFVNMNLKERPRYFSRFDCFGGQIIDAVLPDSLAMLDETERISSHGEILHHYVKDLIGAVDNKNSILEEIKSGRRSYLFNQNYEFINWAVKTKVPVPEVPGSATKKGTVVDAQ